MPSLTAEEAKRLKPYMQLAEQLGSFAGQLTHTGLSQVTIDNVGHVPDFNTRPLTHVALSGLLTPMLDPLKMANAPVVALDRDSAVSTLKLDLDVDYQTHNRL